MNSFSLTISVFLFSLLNLYYVYHYEFTSFNYYSTFSHYKLKMVYQSFSLPSVTFCSYFFRYQFNCYRYCTEQQQQQESHLSIDTCYFVLCAALLSIACSRCCCYYFVFIMISLHWHMVVDDGVNVDGGKRCDLVIYTLFFRCYQENLEIGSRIW